jgi:SPOR domain
MIMKKTGILFFSLMIFMAAHAQIAKTDDTAIGKVTVNKDPRLDILAKQQAEFNKATVGLGAKAAKGYRLLVVSSNDRNFAMKVRTQLLQRYPEQKVYMSYQAPFIKLKFGDFVDRSDAEKYRKMITNSKIVTNNVYLVSEIVEVKGDKNKENDDN